MLPRPKAFVLVSAVLASCAHPAPAHRGGGTTAGTEPSPTTAAAARADRAAGEASTRAPLPLRVDSHFHEDVVVFVVRGGMRQRLGLATAAGVTRFTIPRRFTADGAGFSLLVRSVGGTTGVRSEPVVPQPGQRVVWTLESDLQRSMIALEENPKR